MKDYLFTAIWGIFIWLFAILFFRFFGEYILFSPATNQFIFSTFLLLAGTSLLLAGVTYLYLCCDTTSHAAIKFGVSGTVIGLVLDTFSLSYHHIVFPTFDEAQVIAFTVWMSFAYALFLVIPFLFYQKSRQQAGKLV